MLSCSRRPNQIQMIIMCFCASERLPALRRIWYLIGSCVSAECRVQVQQQKQHTYLNTHHVSCAGTFIMLMQIIWFSQARDVCVPHLWRRSIFYRLKASSKFEVETKKKSSEDHIHRIIGNNFISNFFSFRRRILWCRKSRFFFLYSFNTNKQIFIIILCA